MSSLIVGLYDNVDTAEQVVEDLLNNQVAGEDICMIVNGEEDEDEFFVVQTLNVDEADYEEIDDEDEEDFSADDEVEDLLDILTGMGLAEDQAAYYTDQVSQGRSLVTVNVPAEKVEQVRRIVNQYFPVTIHEQAVSDQSFSSDSNGAH